MRPAIIGIVPPECGMMILTLGYLCSTPFARILVQPRVISKSNSFIAVGTLSFKFVQQGGASGCMYTMALRRLSSCHMGSKYSIAGPVGLIVVGVNPNAVGLQRVEAVFDFLHHAVDIGQRHAREQAKALGMFRHQLGPVIVAGAHRRAALGRIVVEHVAHLRHGQNGDGDVELVHLFESDFWRPGTL